MISFCCRFTIYLVIKLFLLKMYRNKRDVDKHVDSLMFKLAPKDVRWILYLVKIIDFGHDNIFLHIVFTMWSYLCFSSKLERIQLRGCISRWGIMEAVRSMSNNISPWNRIMQPLTNYSDRHFRGKGRRKKQSSSLKSLLTLIPHKQVLSWMVSVDFSLR